VTGNRPERETADRSRRRGPRAPGKVKENFRMKGRTMNGLRKAEITMFARHSKKRRLIHCP